MTDHPTSPSPSPSSPLPRIGVAVIIRRGDRVLLGRRRSQTHGEGTWQFPGGHLEWGETVHACAQREVLEETGLTVTSMRDGPWTNDRFPAQAGQSERHYVTLFVIAEAPVGDAVVCEPGKCECWEWFPWDALPSPRFLPIDNLLALGFQLSNS